MSEATNLPISVSEGETTPITRNNLGQFVKGVSGNPAGKPKGSRSRSKLLREYIEEALLRDLSDEAGALLDQAIKMAKGGDAGMMKLLLGDMLKNARTEVTDTEEDDRKSISVRVTIKNFTGQPGPSAVVIDGTCTEE